MQLFILRKIIENKVREAMSLTDEDVFFASLSSHTIVYKGQLKPDQARFVKSACDCESDCFVRVVLSVQRSR